MIHSWWINCSYIVFTQYITLTLLCQTMWLFLDAHLLFQLQFFYCEEKKENIQACTWTIWSECLPSRKAFAIKCTFSTAFPLVQSIAPLIISASNLFLQFSSVQSLSHVRLFVTPQTTAHQASLSITNSWNILKLMSIESMMHPTISSSVVPFSSCLQSCPASESFLMSPFFTTGGQGIEALASYQSYQWIFRTDIFKGWLVWFLCCQRDSQVSSSTPQFKSINSSCSAFFLWSNSHIYTWLMEKQQLWLDRPLSAK